MGIRGKEIRMIQEKRHRTPLVCHMAEMSD